MGLSPRTSMGPLHAPNLLSIECSKLSDSVMVEIGPGSFFFFPIGIRLIIFFLSIFFLAVVDFVHFLSSFFEGGSSFFFS